MKGMNELGNDEGVVINNFIGILNLINNFEMSRLGESVFRHSEDVKIIRCKNCNLMIESSKFDEHASSHIGPKFLAPSTLENNAKKLAAFSLDQTDCSEELDIKSLRPDIIPRPERDRRDIKPPTATDAIHNNFIDQISLTAINDQNDLTSHLSIGYVEKDTIQPLSLEKSIELAPIITNIVPRKIHFYQKTNVVNENYDQKISNRKINVHGEEEQSERSSNTNSGYEIKSMGENSNSLLPRVAGNGNSVQIAFSKKVGKVNPFKEIETKTDNEVKKGKNYFYNDDEPEKVKPHFDDRSNYSERQKYHDLECHGCHGFHCKTCGSTIPPKYRPYFQEDPNPNLINYYKTLTKLREARQNCIQCTHKKIDDSSSDKESPSKFREQKEQWTEEKKAPKKWEEDKEQQKWGQQQIGNKREIRSQYRSQGDKKWNQVKE